MSRTEQSTFALKGVEGIEGIEGIEALPILDYIPRRLIDDIAFQAFVTYKSRKE